MNRVLGFLCGIGAGACVGLLLAPRSGEKTRSLIRKQAGNSADYLRKQTNEVCDAAADALREGSNKVAKGTEAVRAAVEAGKRAYNQTIHS